MLFSNKLLPKRCESDESSEEQLTVTNHDNLFSIETIKQDDVENEGHMSTRRFKCLRNLGRELPPTDFGAFFQTKGTDNNVNVYLSPDEDDEYVP